MTGCLNTLELMSWSGWIILGKKSVVTSLTYPTNLFLPLSDTLQYFIDKELIYYLVGNKTDDAYELQPCRSCRTIKQNDFRTDSWVKQYDCKSNQWIRHCMKGTFKLCKNIFMSIENLLRWQKYKQQAADNTFSKRSSWVWCVLFHKSNCSLAQLSRRCVYQFAWINLAHYIAGNLSDVLSLGNRNSLIVKYYMLLQNSSFKYRKSFSINLRFQNIYLQEATGASPELHCCGDCCKVFIVLCTDSCFTVERSLWILAYILVNYQGVYSTPSRLAFVMLSTSFPNSVSSLWSNSLSQSKLLGPCDKNCDSETRIGNNPQVHCNDVNQSRHTKLTTESKYYGKNELVTNESSFMPSFIFVTFFSQLLVICWLALHAFLHSYNALVHLLRKLRAAARFTANIFVSKVKINLRLFYSEVNHQNIHAKSEHGFSHGQPNPAESSVVNLSFECNYCKSVSIKFQLIPTYPSWTIIYKTSEARENLISNKNCMNNYNYIFRDAWNYFENNNVTKRPRIRGSLHQNCSCNIIINLLVLNSTYCIDNSVICNKQLHSQFKNDITSGISQKQLSDLLRCEGKDRIHKILCISPQSIFIEARFLSLLHIPWSVITLRKRRAVMTMSVRNGRTINERRDSNNRKSHSLKIERAEEFLPYKEFYIKRKLRRNNDNMSDRRATGLRIPLLLFLLSFLLVGGSATCPRLCACKWKGGKQTVECINKGLTTIPSDIDPGTQVLDLTGNPLVIISREKFKLIGLTNLQRIYVTRCKLVQLDDTAFRGLNNLVELDLSINELRMVPAAALQYLTSLMRLQLSFNPITQIKDGSFGSLGYLTSLELTGCAVESLESLAFQGLDRLEWLKINDNNLTTIPQNMMLPKSLHGVDMHNNPWMCDCKLKQLRNWLVQYNVPSSIEPKCTGPLRLRNRIIKEVMLDELACAPEMRPTSLFLDIIEGKNISFECHVSAQPDADIQWKFNGYPLENSTFVYDDSTSLFVFEEKDAEVNKISHLRIETVTEAHSGIFQCIAKNQAGRAFSNFTLRVSLPPTKPAPEEPSNDHIVYIGAALITLVVLVIILLCTLITICCRRHSKNVQIKSNICSKKEQDKQNFNDRPKSNNMPKYIQMGTPAPKVNGILAETPSISVIENLPYTAEPADSPHINPDLIADSSDDRLKSTKKKVSIIGVEEMDANGVRTTRKLEDIIEENEDHFDTTYDKFEERGGYESAQRLQNNQYSTLTKRQLEAEENLFPLTDLPPDQVPQPNVRYIDQQGFPVEYVLPREQWQNGTQIEHIKRYSPVPTQQSPLYSTLRRSRHISGTHSPLIHDQKYCDDYNLQESSHNLPPPDGRYHQDFGLTSKKICEGGSRFCECCQPPDLSSLPPDYDPREPLGRIRGDGCSFDNLISSCGGQCCYNEKTGQLFDNTLPENYRPLDINPPPPPPEGYGDSEDEVDDDKTTECEEKTHSPGTRVLYSPEIAYSETLIEHKFLNDSVTNV